MALLPRNTISPVGKQIQYMSRTDKCGLAGGCQRGKQHYVLRMPISVKSQSAIKMMTKLPLCATKKKKNYLGSDVSCTVSRGGEMCITTLCLQHISLGFQEEDHCHSHHEDNSESHLSHQAQLHLLRGLVALPQHLLLAGPDVLVSLQLLLVVLLEELVKVVHTPSAVRAHHGPFDLGRFPRAPRALLASGPGCREQVRLGQQAPVVLLPQRLVAQDGVGLADLREAGSGRLATGVSVRVVDEGLLVVGGFNLGLRGGRRYLQDVVISSHGFVEGLRMGSVAAVRSDTHNLSISPKQTPSPL